MPFLKKILLAFTAVLSLSAHGFDPFVVKDIRLEGIQRTEAGTVFSYLPVKVGETMTDEKATQSIRALYATGFFKDVSLEVDNGVLIVVVEERPSIAQIDFIGNKEFEKESLLKGLRAIGIADGRVFDRGRLEKAEQELKRQYISRGKYSAEVTTTITPLERNRVAVRFDIVEGEVAKIRQIGIIGSQVFKEKDLLDLFTLRTSGLLTWYSKNDQYSKLKLAADLEVLRSYYLDRGYLEFNIDSTQVSITPDKKDVYISIGITEGAQYSVSDIKLGGEMLIPEAEVRSLIKLKVGEVFSRTRLTESTKAIGDRLGNDGYAFANVNAAPELDRAARKVAFTFLMDPGRRVYVRRINVTGNNRTRDEVLRREMRQIEGGWYNADSIVKSKQRVDRLGYFTDVSVETPAVPGTTDQVDLNVNVTERPTGSITFGAGYGSAEGVTVSGGITQQNVFGSGNHLGAQVNTSKVNTVYSLSFTQPYWTVDGVSRGFDIYKRAINPTATNTGQYKTSTWGGQLRFGVPVTDLDIVSFGLGYESTSITTFADSPFRVISYVNTFSNDNTTVLGTVGWGRDGRDSVIYPTTGTVNRASLEVGLPGGTLQFYKAIYQHQRYIPLSRDFTLFMNGEIGYGGGLNDKPLPFFRNYYTGGISSVPGYKTNTIGPKDINGDPIGGSKKLVGEVELLFPFPGLQNDKSVRLAAFVATGLAGESYSMGDLRYSAGMSVVWISPLGPLKASAGFPFNKAPSDTIEKFQFTFGQQF